MSEGLHFAAIELNMEWSPCTLFHQLAVNIKDRSWATKEVVVTRRGTRVLLGIK
jgi:hypothetical protein